MNSRLLDCLCAGIVVADHVCDPIERLPEPGELLLTRRMELTIGGCASNVAVDLAKLGLRAALAGAVGDDVFGRHVSDALSTAGVDCRHLRTVPDCDTAGTLIINCRGQDRRFIHSIGANGRFTGREITPKMIAESRLLYLGGYLLCDALTAENAAAMFRAARELGVPTMLDVVLPGPGEYQRRLEPVLPYTDVFLPNEDEGRIMSGMDDPVAQAERFRSMGARTVAVTCGARGAILAGPSGRYRSNAHNVPVVDSTGSGDAFAAGWIYGLLQGADEVQCLRLGSALGARCVMSMGATTGALDAASLTNHLAQHPLTISPI